MKKAILLDSVNKEVRTVEVGEGIEDIYAHLNCRTFDVVGLSGGADMYVDDEALLKTSYVDEDGVKHNMNGLKIMDQFVMGNGLIMGHNEEGESVDSPVTDDQVREVVTFVEYDNPEDCPQPQMGFMPW